MGQISGSLVNSNQKLFEAVHRERHEKNKITRKSMAWTVCKTVFKQLSEDAGEDLSLTATVSCYLLTGCDFQDKTSQNNVEVCERKIFSFCRACL